MSVDQRSVIDIVGVDRSTNRVVLTISDHLDWTTESKHEFVLQDKLNDYLAFAESGELLVAYPDAAGRPVEIAIVFAEPPSETGLRFLASVEPVICAAGFFFSWRVPHGAPTDAA